MNDELTLLEYSTAWKAVEARISEAASSGNYQEYHIDEITGTFLQAFGLTFDRDAVGYHPPEGAEAAKVFNDVIQQMPKTKSELAQNILDYMHETARRYKLSDDLPTPRYEEAIHRESILETERAIAQDVLRILGRPYLLKYSAMLPEIYEGKSP